MADDGQIRIGLSINTSGLSAAQSAAQDAADQIAAAYDKVAEASVQVTYANQRVADVNKQIKAGMLDAATGAKVLSSEMQTQAAAAQQLAAAKAALAEVQSRPPAPVAVAGAEAGGTAVEATGTAAQATGAAFTEMGTNAAEAFAVIEAQGLETVATMEALTASTVEQAAATAAVGEAQATQAAELDAVTIAYRELAAAQMQSNIAQAELSAGYKAFRGVAADDEGAISTLAFGEQRAAAAAQELAAAKERLATAIAASKTETTEDVLTLGQDTAAAWANTGATMERAEAYGAARVGLAAMTGSVGAMGYGLARVAASSATLGPLLQAAFIPIAAIAMVEIIGEMGQKLYEFISEAQETATELGSGWLEGAIAQMNGLAKAVKQADDELSTLAKDADTLSSQTQKAAIEHTRLTEGPAAAFRAEADLKLAEVQKNQALLAVLREDQTSLQQRAAQTQGAGSVFATAAPTTDALKAKQQLRVIDEQINSIQGQNNLLQQEANNLAIQASQVKPKKESTAPAHDQMLEWQAALDAQRRTHLESVADEATYWDQILAKLKPGSANYDAVLRRSAELHQEIFRQQAEQQAHLANTSHSDDSSAQRLEKIAELQQQLANPPRRSGLDTMQANLDALDREHQKLMDNFALQQEQAKANQSGVLYGTPGHGVREAGATAQLHAQEAAADQNYFQQKATLITAGYQQQIQEATDAAKKESQVRIDAAKAEQDQIAANVQKQGNTPQAQKTGAEDAAAVQQKLQEQQLEAEVNLRNQIEQLKQQEQQKLNQIDQQETADADKAHQQQLQDMIQKQTQMLAAVRQNTNEMNQAFTSGLNQWLTSTNVATRSFTTDMGNAARKVAVQFIDQMVQMGLRFVENETMMVVKYVELQALKRSIDTSTAAAGLATQETARTAQIASNVALATSDSGVAAAGAAASQAGIPIVGPELAAAAGSAALAQGAAFTAVASAAGGSVVQGANGEAIPYIVHGGEAVLPQALTTMLMGVANNGGGGGGGHAFHLHYSPTNNVLDSKGLESFTRRAGTQMSTEMRRQVRRMNLATT